MKVVIAGGTSQAEFIISMFKGKKNELIVINPSKEVGEALAKRCRVTVNTGAPWRQSILEEANAYDADVFISLCEKDSDNYASCMMAKRVFAAKKTICVVNNPKNVEIYKRLGLDSVISSTYLLAQSIRGESSINSIIKTLSLDNDKLNVVEAVILSKYSICFEKIKDIKFPRYASIAAIYRNYRIIIPSGMVTLQPKDTLLMVTAPENTKKLLAYVQTERGGGLASITSLIRRKAKDDDGSESSSPDGVGLYESENQDEGVEEASPKKRASVKEVVGAKRAIAAAKHSTIKAQLDEGKKKKK